MCGFCFTIVFGEVAFGVYSFGCFCYTFVLLDMFSLVCLVE